MNAFEKELNTLRRQKELIGLEFMEVYPYHKVDVDNPEIQNVFNNIEYNLEETYNKLDALLSKVTRANREKEKNLQQLNDIIREEKTFYNMNKPKLQNVIDDSQSGLPREKDFLYKLNNQYYNLGYNILLFIPMVFLYHKLLHS
mgnify:CR=1 FL=1